MMMEARLGVSMAVKLQSTLGQDIVGGFYENADFPNEAELAVKYQTSRTVVREAIKMLTAKGLISSRPKRGTCVASMSSWNLLDPDVMGWLVERPFSRQVYREFTQMRIGIEPVAAALASQSRDDDLIDAIGQQLEIMKHAGGDFDAELRADIQFHVAILRASGNAFFWRLKELIHTALHMSIQITNRDGGPDIAAHEKVFLAIRRRDFAGSEQAMRALLDRVQDLIEHYDPVTARFESPQP